MISPLTRALIFLLLVVGQGRGQGIVGSASFLSRGMAAGGVTLGGACVATVDDASAVYWNPAGLTFAPDVSVMVSDLVDLRFSSGFGDVQYPQLAASFSRRRPLLGLRNLAIGFGYAGFQVRDISNYDENANYLGSSNFSESVMFLSLAFQVRSIRLGMSWKYFQQAFTGASSFSQTNELSNVTKPHDIGIIFELTSFLKFGIIIRDSVRIGAYDFTSREAQMGFGLDIKSFTLSVDLRGITNDIDRLLIGLEYQGTLARQQFNLRLGLNNALESQQSGGLSRDAKGSIGIGLKGRYFGVDIGWIQELAPNLMNPYSAIFIITTSIRIGGSVLTREET